jgi:hypothetical protein
VVSDVQPEASKDAAAAQPKQEQQTATANEPPPPPKVSATPTPEESPRREAEVTSKEVRELPVTTPSAGKTLGRAEYREDRDKDAKARKPATVATAQGTGSGNMQADGVDMSASTRTVAGRRFRKQGGVWIDTAYDSSKNVVTVTRNSEQYRGLVGDEPAIKTIADTLDGEIIVVWKGRTYRIH